MPATIFERLESRNASIGNQQTDATLEYVVFGTDDQDEATALVDDTRPDVFQGGDYLRTERKPGPASDIWFFTVFYTTAPQRRTGDTLYTFQTGGSTVHIRTSLETISRNGIPGTTPPNYKQAINVRDGVVEGTDIVAPDFCFAETHYFAVGDISDEYIQIVRYLTGTVNDDTWKGFQKGEVLFMGASGSQRGIDDWEITYHFRVRDNTDEIVVGDIEAFSAEGWFYVWFRFDDVADGKMVQRPTAAYVERVYDYGDFTLLDIGS
jgi:hypothetical protein